MGVIENNYHLIILELFDMPPSMSTYDPINLFFFSIISILYNVVNFSDSDHWVIKLPFWNDVILLFGFVQHAITFEYTGLHRDG